MSKLTLHEIKKKKAECEQEILKIISKFEDETELSVSSFKTLTSQPAGIKNQKTISIIIQIGEIW